MYSNFCLVESSWTSQFRSIKLFLQCAAEYQLTSFIEALTQSQSNVVYHSLQADQNIKISVKINQNADHKSIQKSVKTSIKNNQNTD